ncbi:hypothetical protein F5Y03DRAFT_29804 [Xylaria venustula]|nr:hypothetical protein F5Y03DRAFT_29804 [Xylaria venustula]
MDHQRYRNPSISSAESYHSDAFSQRSAASLSTVVTSPDGNDVHYAPTEGMSCEFFGYSSCPEVFDIGDVEAWIHHIIVDHFHNKLPRKVDCWFCNDYQFDSDIVGDRLTNFYDRMYHIRDHFYYERKTAADMRPDYDLNEHLRKHKLISEESYNAVRRYDEVAQGPDIYGYDQLPYEIQSRHERGDVQIHDSRREKKRDKDRQHKHKHGKSRK